MKVTEQQIEAQKDNACVLGIKLSELIELNTGNKVEIEYVTVLQALSDLGLRLTYVGEKKDIAGMALVDAICHDYDVPERQRHQKNIFTMWIGKIADVSSDEALKIHNYIDDNALINWKKMDSIVWTVDMDIALRGAVREAINAMNEREIIEGDI